MKCQFGVQNFFGPSHRKSRNPSGGDPFGPTPPLRGGGSPKRKKRISGAMHTPIHPPETRRDFTLPCSGLTLGSPCGGFKSRKPCTNAHNPSCYINPPSPNNFFALPARLIGHYAVQDFFAFSTPWQGLENPPHPSFTTTGRIDRCWLFLSLALIGEHFKDGDEICGAVAGVWQECKVSTVTQHLPHVGVCKNKGYIRFPDICRTPPPHPQ